MTTPPRQITFAPHGQILTHTGVWSPDSRWIYYDIRSDAAGSIFDGTRIERVEVETGRVERMYESTDGACCGVVTASPVDDRIVFIHGPAHPTPDWGYAAHHRRGVIVDVNRPGVAVTLDARDLVAPYTPGALRGGTHLHTFSADGQCIIFTYEDHPLAALDADVNAPPHESNQRNVGVSLPLGPVQVPRTHRRNHDGSHYTMLLSCTSDHPRPGSDEITQGCSDAWVGPHRRVAFLGHVIAADGRPIVEAFIVDVPDATPSHGDLITGTPTTRPRPPAGIYQRRLTFTADRPYPGISGPRHWLDASPDGDHIAMLMRDDAGVVQLCSVPSNGGPITFNTRNAHDIASAFTWSRDGRYIAHVMDRSVCVSDTHNGQTIRLTDPTDDATTPRPEACVFSPDGRRIAYVRRVPHDQGGVFNQIFVATAPGE